MLDKSIITLFGVDLYYILMESSKDKEIRKKFGLIDLKEEYYE